jgi:hypothetical protein
VLRGVEVLAETLETIIDPPMRARERVVQIKNLEIDPTPEADR